MFVVVFFFGVLPFFSANEGFIGEDLRLRIAGRLAMGLQAGDGTSRFAVAEKGLTGQHRQEKTEQKWEQNEQTIKKVQ